MATDFYSLFKDGLLCFGIADLKFGFINMEVMRTITGSLTHELRGLTYLMRSFSVKTLPTT